MTALDRKLKKIKVLALDVDGVLTDGKIIIDNAGKEIKNFDVKDGYAIVLFRKAGYQTAIISARKAIPVTARAKDLLIDRVYQNAYPKINFYQKLLKDMRVKDEEVCFVGDDLPDLQVIKQAGLGVAVNDAVLEVKRAADYVTKKKGGRGAVREVIELILKAQGKWEHIVKSA